MSHELQRLSSMCENVLEEERVRQRKRESGEGEEDSHKEETWLHVSNTDRVQQNGRKGRDNIKCSTDTSSRSVLNYRFQNQQVIHSESFLLHLCELGGSANLILETGFQAGRLALKSSCMQIGHGHAQQHAGLELLIFLPFAPPSWDYGCPRVLPLIRFGFHQGLKPIGLQHARQTLYR